MKLIYLVIGNINRNISNLDFSFSEEFSCEYCNKEITIEKKIKYDPIVYSRNILSIHAIVGKNGAGKSSILSLLGLNVTDRFNFFLSDSDRKDFQWFAIFYLKDSSFVIEGNDINFSPSSISSHFAPYSVQNFYSIKFKYSFECSEIIQDSISFIQEQPVNKGKNKLDLSNYLFFILSQNISYPSWYYKQTFIEKNVVYDLGFKRFYSSNSFGKSALLGKLFYNLFNNKKESNSLSRMFGRRGFAFNSKIPVSVSISLKKIYNEESFADELSDLDKKLFPLHGWARNTSLFTQKIINYERNKQIFILRFIESILYYILRSAKEKNPDISIQQENVTDYQSQKRILIEKICVLITQYFSDNFEYPFIVKHNDYQLSEELNKSIIDLCDSIEKIVPECFTSDSCINVDYSDNSSDCLDSFLNLIDLSVSSQFVYPLNFSYYFDIKFKGLSSGQISLFNFYSVLYERIRKMHDLGYKKGSTCVLLLDEPDLSFHPEWSRKFIYLLTQFLSLDAFNDYKYQIIIATHSPFILTDIERSNCICLTDIDGVIIKSYPNQSFLCRLDDLMVDTFFVDSIFGEFSERYVNRIIEDIRKYLDNPSCVSSEEIKALELKICKISNETVRNSLILKLSQIKMQLEISND